MSYPQIATLEGCSTCSAPVKSERLYVVIPAPDNVPELDGFSLKGAFKLPKINLGSMLKLPKSVNPWAKRTTGKTYQKQGQTAALIGAATGNKTLQAFGAARYMEGRGQVKSANRSIRTISDVGKAAAVIAGGIVAAPLIGGALAGSGAAAAGAGAAGAGAAGAGAAAAGAAGAGAGLAAAGVPASAGLLSTIGSGLATAASYALPALAVSAGLPLVQQLLGAAAQMGVSPQQVQEAVQTGAIDQLPPALQEYAAPAWSQLMAEAQAQPQTLMIDPQAYQYPTAEVVVKKDGEIAIEPTGSGQAIGAGVVMLGGLALFLAMSGHKSGNKKGKRN